ncbi:MAG TPA: gliding motility-associated C-terminal domain-containing protein, partial [Bacteroidia bacterium]|nr:gliding motility-associated C-terminal domain-containing protein [Bacteroidia bacterium]
DFGDGSGATTQNTLHIFPAPGEYNVMHITNNIFGCPDTFYVEIFIPDTFFIPNIFTPSGNNKNDTWIIPNTGFKNAHLEIFDRWGIKVYESNAPTISWDGHTYSGKMLSDGTYYFIADIDMKVPPGSKPKKIKLKGPITLLSHDK